MKEKRNENKYFDPQIGKTIFLIALRDIVSIPVSDLCSTYLIDHIRSSSSYIYIVLLVSKCFVFEANKFNVLSTSFNEIGLASQESL